MKEIVEKTAIVLTLPAIVWVVGLVLIARGC